MAYVCCFAASISDKTLASDMFSSWYIGTTLTLSASLAVMQFALPDIDLSTLFAVSPALIALVFSCFDKQRPLSSLGWQPNFRYWLVILTTIASMTAILLLIAWCADDAKLNHVALKKFLRASTLSGFLLGILVNTGEEAGWRGYLFPKLYEERGWWEAVGLTSVVWWLWHVPFMVIVQIRQFGEIQWGTQITQLVGMIPACVLLSYWFLRSNSFWAIGFAHQLTNFVNKWFLGLEHSAKSPIFFGDKGLAHTYGLENGILGLVVLYLTAAVIFQRNQRFCLDTPEDIPLRS